ncbi:Gfo/Idh/MocA family protein [Vibrio viridaestus]|uniref:Gfo/Idh/MocA family oxidoreductase n=1 Tax=Vibrio viridaestus TaxID=2487322 RepID=A0A3N9U4M6_9VIBR|nr:Gfo/Idh/MocA family oxidoreductase [Vibrio viridaestus]RQW64582.1 gfo/Idh/MocA family oxidoreductase [Vibrio viridaestus]
MNPLKVGIIGIGDISDVYINNLKRYSDVLEIVACASRGLEKAKQKAEQHSIPRPYASGMDVINDPDVDIVLNLTIPAVHNEFNIAALKAGKHLYSEKPLGSDLEGAKIIMQLAAEKGLMVGCAPDTFMGARLQTCRELIDNDVIGDLIGASAFCMYHGTETFHPNPDFTYKPGAGPLLDIGPYYVTALLALMGPVKSCSAMGKRSYEKREILSQPRKGEYIDVEVDTHILGNLEFQNGAMATMNMSFDIWDSELPRIEIYGTKGTLCIKDIDPLDGPNLFGGDLLLKTKEDYRWYGFPRASEHKAWVKVPSDRPFDSVSHAVNSRGIGMVDMVYALKNGRKPRASGEMAYHSLEVMTKMLLSAQEKRFYDIDSTFELPKILDIQKGFND